MIRIYELSSELGLDSKEIIARLRKKGIEVTSHSSSVDDAEARAILSPKKKKSVSPTPAAKPIPKVTATSAKRTAAASLKPRTAAVVAAQKKVAPAAESRPVPVKKKEPLPAALRKKPAEAPPPPPVAPPAPPAVAKPAAPPLPPPRKESPAPAPSGVKPPPAPSVRPTPPAAAPVHPIPQAAKASPPAPPVRPTPAPLRAPAPVKAQTGAPAAPPTVKTPPPPSAPVVKAPPRPPVVKAPPPAPVPPPPAAPPPPPPPPPVLRVAEAMTVKDLAERLGKSVGEVIKRLMKRGIMATINQMVDVNVIAAIATEFGFEVAVAPIEAAEAAVEEVQDPARLRPRPPVVTIMGHVDHGKTSLLDAIRQTHVTEGEAGGITQHIGAYEVDLDKGRVVFLDTPGHEAFTAMRARGAQVTDIVVLVVAADDGVMPQTIEAINHAKDATVPILVAVNKIDKPGADPNRVKQQLSEYGLVPEEWGGQTIFVEVSAKKHLGIERLLEMLLLLAEIQEFKADPIRLAQGTIVEAKLDRGRGPVASALIRRGTLRVGDPVVVGLHFGRVRALLNDRGKKLTEAGPSVPVEILGLSGVPEAGDILMAVSDERKARQIALSRQQKRKDEVPAARETHVTLEDLHRRIQEGEIKELRLIIKADVQGSVGAVREALERLSTPAVRLRVIHAAVGAITESDVVLASASNAIILGFGIRPEPKAQRVAEQERVEVRMYTVIYDAIAEIRAAMEGLLAPTFVERLTGRAEVRNTFTVSKVGTIAGCAVTEGRVTRDALVRLVRDGKTVHEGKVASLRRFKDDVREVGSGYECGIALENFNDVKVGDLLEVYEKEAVAQKL